MFQYICISRQMCTNSKEMKTKQMQPVTHTDTHTLAPHTFLLPQRSARRSAKVSHMTMRSEQKGERLGEILSSAQSSRTHIWITRLWAAGQNTHKHRTHTSTMSCTSVVCTNPQMHRGHAKCSLLISTNYADWWLCAALWSNSINSNSRATVDAFADEMGFPLTPGKL